MNNDGNGATYRKVDDTSFGKSDWLGRESARQTYTQKYSSISSVDSIEAEAAALEKLGQQLSKINNESKRSSEERKKLLDEVARAQKDLLDYTKKNGADEKELLKLYEKSISAREKILKKYVKNNGFLLKQLDLEKADIKEMIALSDKLGKSKGIITLSNKLKDLSADISDLSKALNLDKLANSEGIKSLRELRKNTMTSMNLSSNQFQSFKNDLISEVRQLNKNVGTSLYGLDDVKWYLSSLNELGIYSTTLAEQQVTQAIIGNKLLGLSLETQAQFIKTMKRTDNKELLQQQNETIASLLKSNLEVSKEQLAIAAGNTADLLDKMSYMGITGDALSNMNKSATAGQAAVISAYGVDTNTAVYSVLSDMFNNTNSDYYWKAGGDATNNALRNGDYGTALQSLMNSDYYKKLASMSDWEIQNMVSHGQATGEDMKIAAMVRESSKLNMEEYNKVMSMDSKEAKKYLDDIQKKQAESLTWQEKLENWFGLFFGQLPWQVFVGLANTAFTLYIASALLEMPTKIHKFLTVGLKDLKWIFNGLTNLITTGGAKLLATIGPWGTAILGIAALVGAFFMFKNDWERAEEQKMPKWQALLLGTREGIGNVLWSIGKYLLVGLGVAMLVAAITGATTAIAPILLIAAAIGAIAGIIGAIFNRKKDVGGALTGIGGEAGWGIGGSSDGKGGRYSTSAGVSTKPWAITSRYGWRKLEGKDNFHRGIDIASKSRTPIGANRAGTVVNKGTGWSGGRGNFVTIKDANGLKHSYFHMIEPTKLKKGDYVNAGQIVGYMGNTGHSFGTHLHYQVNKPNGSSTNPEPYVTRNIINASAFGIADGTNTNKTATSKRNKDEEKDQALLGRFIAEDTKQADATAAKYANYFASETGLGGPDDDKGITGTVNKGFGNLIEKLEELSTKQEDQERILAALTSNKSTSLYRY